VSFPHKPDSHGRFLVGEGKLGPVRVGGAVRLRRKFALGGASALVGYSKAAACPRPPACGPRLFAPCFLGRWSCVGWP
jgi:hypothetical protein